MVNCQRSMHEVWPKKCTLKLPMPACCQAIGSCFILGFQLLIILDVEKGENQQKLTKKFSWLNGHHTVGFNLKSPTWVHIELSDVAIL